MSGATHVIPAGLKRPACCRQGIQTAQTGLPIEVLPSESRLSDGIPEGGTFGSDTAYKMASRNDEGRISDPAFVLQSHRSRAQMLLLGTFLFS